MIHTYIVLLRAVNVSGKNIIRMQELRSLLQHLGYEDIRTYIQSGNIILTSLKSREMLQQEIKSGIYKRFGHTV